MGATQAEWDAQIRRAAHDIRARSEALIAKDWNPGFAFEEACNHAAEIGSRTELTIQMMTLAASSLTDWSRWSEFKGWWNARFPNAPRVSEEQFAAPCLMQIGGLDVAVISPWSRCLASLAKQKADA